MLVQVGYCGSNDLIGFPRWRLDLPHGLNERGTNQSPYGCMPNSVIGLIPIRVGFAYQSLNRFTESGVERVNRHGRLSERPTEVSQIGVGEGGIFPGQFHFGCQSQSADAAGRAHVMLASMHALRRYHQKFTAMQFHHLPGLEFVDRSTFEEEQYFKPVM